MSFNMSVRPCNKLTDKMNGMKQSKNDEKVKVKNKDERIVEWSVTRADSALEIFVHLQKLPLAVSTCVKFDHLILIPFLK